jgi:hypothetical protein
VVTTLLSSYTTYPMASKLLKGLKKGLKLLKNHIKEHRDIIVAKLNKKRRCLRGPKDLKINTGSVNFFKLLYMTPPLLPKIDMSD